MWLSDSFESVVAVAVLVMSGVGLVVGLLMIGRYRRQRSQKQVKPDLLQREHDDIKKPLCDPAISVQSIPQTPTSADDISELSCLSDLEKHHLIYRFFPTFRGNLLSGQDLEGYFADAVRSGLRKGWSKRELMSAARSNNWKRGSSSPD